MVMDSELLARLSPAHQRRLAWFEEHQGEVSGIPGPLADGLLLVSKPKGIYKPGDLPYALSIRINLDSPYADGVPVPTPGGGWLLSYHQEDADPADRDRMFTNRGLMQCIADRVPVGVLRERAPAGRRSQYDVLGLAMPVRWSDGYFFFESLNPRAMPVTDPVSDILEATALAEADQEAAARGEDPKDDYDARLRVFRQIVARRGQSAFREALLEAYQGRCAITGCDAAAALEGAHLRPYRGPDSNAVTNGLLLRADIHTLFDLRLLAPDPGTRNIVVSKLLAGTQYELLSACQLADPAAAWQRPSQGTLEVIWRHFREAEDDR
jgi:putative restriction endonuclease